MTVLITHPNDDGFIDKAGIASTKENQQYCSDMDAGHPQELLRCDGLVACCWPGAVTILTECFSIIQPGFGGPLHSAPFGNTKVSNDTFG